MIIFKQREFTNQSYLRDNTGLIKQSFVHIYVITSRVHPLSDKHHLGELLVWMTELVTGLYKDKKNKPEKFISDLREILLGQSQQGKNESKLYKVTVGSVITEMKEDYGKTNYKIDDDTWEKSVDIFTGFLRCKNKSELGKAILEWSQELKN